MTAPDDRNPLARALDDASRSPLARGYTVPVAAVRAAARRRRARRTGGLAAIAVVVVGGVAGGTVAGLSLWQGGTPVPPGPGATGPVAATADWPAQFGRCGQPADAVLPNLGEPMALSLRDARASVPADGAWTAAVTADLAANLPRAEGGLVAVVWATDLSVVSDGVVVGVQDGPTAPDLSQSLEDRLGGAGLPNSPFPVTTDVTLALASCDPYPSGAGSPDLPPGRYDLVVTQTISYAPAGAYTDAAAVGTLTDARVSTRTTLEVTAPTATEAPDPTACGASADGLATLADPQANPSAFPLDGRATGKAVVGLPLPMAFSVPAGAADVLGGGLVLSRVQAVLTQDEVVVGTAERADQGGVSISFGVPQDCRADHPAGIGAPLAAGSYQVWVVLDVHPTGPTTSDVRVAAGPWPVTLGATG